MSGIFHGRAFFFVNKFQAQWSKSELVKVTNFTSPTTLVPDGIVYGNAPSLERIVGKHPPSRSKRNYKFFMLNKLEAMNIN